MTFSSPCLIAFLPLHAEPREQGGSGEHITNVVTASEEQEAAPERGLSAFCFFYPYLPSAAFFLCLLAALNRFPPFSFLRAAPLLLQEQTQGDPLCSTLPACTAPPFPHPGYHAVRNPAALLNTSGRAESAWEIWVFMDAPKGVGYLLDVFSFMQMEEQ